jgi:hypothetical protein
MKEHTIETIGHVEKKEILKSIGYNNLVLESEHPFPGYHGTTVPDQDNPKSLFLLTKTKYADEFIIRSVKAVKKKNNYTFDGTPGKVYYQNTMVNCIRIKDLDSYSKIPDILKAFKDEGVAFLSGKKVKPYAGLMRVTKYFLLSPINDSTLQDADVASMKYFQTPIKLGWDEFEEMTMHVKRNTEDANWDAALATIYRKTGIEDYIRIYNDQNCDVETLDKIREKYLQEIKKLM